VPSSSSQLAVTSARSRIPAQGGVSRVWRFISSELRACFRVGAAVGLAILLLAPATAWADDVTRAPPEDDAALPRQVFGGPQSVSGQLLHDREVQGVRRFSLLPRPSRTFVGWKDRLARRTGLSLGADYNVFFQQAAPTLSGTPGNAAAGIFRVYGNWSLVARDTDREGSFVFKVESRSRLGTKLSPNDLGLAQGSLFPSATTFSDWGWGISNLEWQQHVRLGEVRGGFALGQVDVTDWLTVLEPANPWVGFTSIVPLVYPTNPVPDQGLGAMAFVFLRDQSTPYVMLGTSDADGEPTRPFGDSPIDTRAWYSYAEVGWTPSYAERYQKNVRLTWWNVDAREAAGSPAGSGVSATATWKIGCDRWSPFLHAGHSFGGAALARTSVSVGSTYALCQGDLAGLALAWARPTDDELRNQVSMEVFYNFQVSEHLHVTPDIQLVLHPSRRPAEEVLCLLGLRIQLDL